MNRPADQKKQKRKRYPTCLLFKKLAGCHFMIKGIRRAGSPQQVVLLGSLCILIAALQATNLYQVTTQPAQHQRPQLHRHPHRKLILPQDIALPDSLDVNMIRQYREWKRKQDSATDENVK